MREPLGLVVIKTRERVVLVVNLWMIQLLCLYSCELGLQSNIPLFEDSILFYLLDYLIYLFISLLRLSDFILMNCSHLKRVFGKVFRETCFVT